MKEHHKSTTPRTLLPSVRLDLSNQLLKGGEDAAEARKLIARYSDNELAALLRMGLTDWTGLPNKDSLHEEINSTLANKAAFGVLAILDLIAFKMINDTYGQAFGDTVIQLAATALGNTIRSENRTDATLPSDDIYTQIGSSATRIGGDEFALFLKGGEQLASANHDKLIRTKLEAMLSNAELVQIIGKLGMRGFGVRAQIIAVDPTIQKSTAEVLDSIGAKEAYTCEYQLLPNDNEDLVVTKIK